MKPPKEEDWETKDYIEIPSQKMVTAFENDIDAEEELFNYI